MADGTFWSARASEYMRAYFHTAALAPGHRAVACPRQRPGHPDQILAAAGAEQWAMKLAELRSEAQKTASRVRM